MSLQKKFITEKGIEYDYHRLSGINIDYDTNTVTVKIKHYTANIFRDNEKKAVVFKNALSEKNKKLEELMALERTEELNDEIIKLSNEINAMFENQVPEEELYLFESVDELPWSKDMDISQTGIYKAIKQTNAYKDAKDI